VINKDPHFNVFYSYAQGGFDDLAAERTLEDNLTRAVIVTLESSSSLTGAFLQEFLALETPETYDYKLQPGDADTDRKRLRPYVLAIGRRKDTPAQQEISDATISFMDGLRSADKKAERSRLQNTLQQTAVKLGNTDISEDAAIRDLKKLLHELGAPEGTLESFQQLTQATAKYLFDLTKGSRPDATIQGKGFIVAIESKLAGSVTFPQIHRHVREHLGHTGELRFFEFQHGQEPDLPTRNQVPVILCSWRDVHSFFRSACLDPKVQQNPQAAFLANHLCNYLEVLGMGELSFSTDDFLRWESAYDRDREWIRSLLGRVEGMAERLADHLAEGHWVKRQAISPHYLGVNIVHGRYRNKQQPVQVPHWSLAIQQLGGGNRHLRLFVQCEGTQLVKGLLQRRDDLAPKLVDSLCRTVGTADVVLRIEEKLFLAPGGKGTKANIWTDYLSFPLELCRDKEDVERVVQQALDAMRQLFRPTHVAKLAALPGTPGKAVVPVLQANFQMNWLELENQGVDIADKLAATMDLLRPYYNTLLEFAPAS
jgi:hypothetical protein